MKQLVILLTGAFALFHFSACTKCYVCKDKTQDEFYKIEYCDKDFDKGDIQAAIEDEEANGAVCHAKTRAF